MFSVCKYLLAASLVLLNWSSSKSGGNNPDLIMLCQAYKLPISSAATTVNRWPLPTTSLRQVIVSDMSSSSSVSSSSSHYQHRSRPSALFSASGILASDSSNSNANSNINHGNINNLNYGIHLKLRKGRLVLTLWGFYCGLVTFAVAAATLPVMAVLAVLSDIFGDGRRRRLLDWMVHIWARVSLSLALCKPRVTGLQNLLPMKNLLGTKPCIFVPNHTSFLDILLLSAYVPRPLKYLSKAEIGRIPIVGWAMQLAKHAFLRRDGGIRSTLAATEATRQLLLDGNSVVLFAEGTRSLDGVLKSFKKGAFQLARETGALVIPVSIGGLQRYMPPQALLPTAPMFGTSIVIHAPIDPRDKTVTELRRLCFQAVNSGLPADQQTVVEDPKTAPLLAVKDREDDRSGAINEKPADSPTVSEPATTTMTSTTSKDS